MHKLANIFLMAPPEGGKSGGGMEQFLFIGLIIVVFYFFMIRPQMKKQKQQNKYRESIKKGDKIITIGGIHGKILEIKDTTFLIEVEGGNKLKIQKNAISMDASNNLLAEGQK